MQTIYIADLPLAADRAATWQGLQDTVERWIDNRLEVHLGPDAPAATSPDGNAEARRQGLAIDATSGWRVVRWDTRQSIPATPAWRYHVTVWVSQNQDRVDGLSVRCRLGIESTTGQVAPPDVPLLGVPESYATSWSTTKWSSTTDASVARRSSEPARSRSSWRCCRIRIAGYPSSS